MLLGLNKYMVGTIAVLVVVLLIMMQTISNQRTKIAIQDQNISILNDGMTTFKTRDSLHAARIGVLQSDIGDLKRYNSDLVEDIESMNLSLRKLKTAIKMSSVTEFNNYTNVKDSTIIKNDTTYIHISEYKDEWLTFYHSVKNNQTDSLHIKTEANFNQFVYWDREGFWPIRWLKRKKYYLVSKSKNPYVKIKSLQAIEVTRNN